MTQGEFDRADGVAREGVRVVVSLGQDGADARGEIGRVKRHGASVRILKENGLCGKFDHGMVSLCSVQKSSGLFSIR